MTTRAQRRLMRALDRDADLVALSGVAEAINESPDVATLLQRTLEIVIRVTALDAGCAHRLDEEEEALYLCAQLNLSERARELVQRFELGEGVIGRAAVLGETVAVTDAAGDRRVARRELINERVGALVATPLIGRGGVRGVLTLFCHAARRFVDHELRLLTTVGRQVGLALEHAQLFEEIRSAQREWERTFDALTDGVSIHAPSGRIRRANRSLAAMFGTEPEALIGKRCCEIYHDSPKPREDCTIMRTVTERCGQVVELGDRLRGRVLRLTTDPITAPDGRITGVVCVTRDVTDEKLIERRLIQQERTSAIGEIAAGIAHEVGTPLNIISANIEYLLRDAAFAARADELRAIGEQAENIAALVQRLLDFARDTSPQLVAVDLNALIERTMALLAPQFHRSRIDVRLELAPYISVIDGDPAQLQQVLFNIINNARQAMEALPPERARRLTIATDSVLVAAPPLGVPHVVVEISDTGLGIPATALPHVFKPFFTANKDGGTGLGLAISHRIVQRHAGSLTIDRSDHDGTTVCIRLPIAHS